jgi:hypothetical protein
MNKQLLANRLSHSLEFSKRAIQHLILEKKSASEDDPWYVRPEKIIAESAFLLVFANEVKNYEQVSAAFDSLVEILEPLARSEAMFLNVCLKPALALDYAHSHICLSYLGYPDIKFDDALKDALNSEAANGIERPPYRMLEREWLRSIWEGKPTKDGFDFWMPLSCLNNQVDLFSDGSDGVYALTHAIMYTAFWGEEISNLNITKQLSTVETLLVRFMDEQNYDIAGELLMAWPLLRTPMPPTARFALECILKIEERVGFLPAPGLNRSMVDGKEIEERRTYIYSINYHTVMVMGLLCASLLRNDSCFAGNIKMSEANYSKRLKTFLLDELYDGKQAHWIEFFSALDLEKKQELIPWLYQSFLGRYVISKRYGHVKKILELGKGSNLENIPASRQANELLCRLANNAM